VQNLNINNQYPISQQISLSFTDGLIILFFALIAGLLVRFLYLRYAQSFSSKSSFGDTLLLVTISVAGLIAVVKSSLALSLGLVGALSVIRFRTAVKEPYTLSYILFSVCLGISIGASQYLFSLLIGIVGTIATIFSFNRSIEGGTRKLRNNDIDTINIVAANEVAIDNAVKLISKNSYKYVIKTISNNSQSQFNATFGVQIISNTTIMELTKEISKLDGINNIIFYNDPS